MDYEKVIKDFNSGVLDKKCVQLVMDNDGGYWQVDTGCEELDEIVNAQLEKMYGVPNGYRDIVDVLNAAGVPTDWC